MHVTGERLCCLAKGNTYLTCFNLLYLCNVGNCGMCVTGERVRRLAKVNTYLTCFNLLYLFNLVTCGMTGTGERVRRLAMHPSEPSWLVSAFNWNSEVSMWDAETRLRQKTLWPSNAPPLSYTKVYCAHYFCLVKSRPWRLIFCSEYFTKMYIL